MARTTPGVTRQRLLDEAVRLFSSKGYAATSVADIQVACGLAAGSGALYKHFPSKRALLEEAVRQSYARTAERGRTTTAPRDEDPRAALERMARVVWEVIDADRDLIRIMLREYDEFPELFGRMWQGVVAHVYGQGAAWIGAQRERGVLDVADPEASAAVLLASLTYVPLLSAMIGRTPGDLDRERFLAAWIEHAAAALKLGG